MTPLQSLLATLVAHPSVTPHDAGCQETMMAYLEALGFHCQRFDHAPVSNFYAQIGTEGPLLLFAGHTDVVPAGDDKAWHTPPFELHVRDGYFYGRGVADMKGSLACMLLAVTRFLSQEPLEYGRIGFLITSGEEGDDFEHGTPHVMRELKKQGIHPTYCLVGEPSSEQALGDIIKIGRRGSLTARITLQGKQGHVAYPHLADNPIHKLAPALHALTTLTFDEGNAFFPPTSLQITHIQAGGQANNLIPGDITLHLNLRYNTEHTAASLQAMIEQCFQQHQLTPAYQWQHNGEPFLTPHGHFVETCSDIIQQHTHRRVKTSTGGGTSDARFIAPYGIDVLELGPLNATIHQVNECVAIADLECLTSIYEDCCRVLTCKPV